MLTLAKDQAGLPEGQAAMRMAMREMAKHSIQESEIDLEKGRGTVGTTIFEDEDGWEGLMDEGGKRQWVSSLASSIARTFSGRVWIDTYKGTVHFLATAGDLETCLFFMDVVYSHIERAARKECPKVKDWKKRNVFGQAAWEEVNNRLREMKREMDSAVGEFAGGSELMVVKGDLVQKTTDQLFKERGFGSSSARFLKSNDQRLINAGRVAGKSAPLHRAINQ
jgi:hypothetical protein